MNTPSSDKLKFYYPKMTATWWLKKRQYFLFMLREFSSVFIAIFLVVFLLQLYQLRRGPQAYAAFAQMLASPGWIIFHVIALLFALYHTLTWLNLMPQTLVIRLGKRQVPPMLITAVNIGGWLGVSLVILWLFLFVRS